MIIMVQHSTARSSTAQQSPPSAAQHSVADFADRLVGSFWGAGLGPAFYSAMTAR